MYVEDSREIHYRGSIIYVDPRIMSTNEIQNSTREFHIVAENVYVKRSDSFKVILIVIFIPNTLTTGVTF